MTAEYLDLGENCLTEPAEYDLAVVGVRMLWPHDPKMRGRYLSAGTFSLLPAAIKHLSVPKPTLAEVSELEKMTLSAPRVEDFTEAMEKATAHGLIAGGVLLEVVGARDVGRENVELAGIKTNLAARLKRWGRMSQKTIDNVVWPRYRSVAHYWTAHILISMETGSGLFPCQMADLDFFLATADACRLRGEAIRSAPQATKPFLRLGEAVLIPPALALPGVELIFSTKK